MQYVIAFVVITMLTILVTRLYLIATGFPQIGGDGLHVAHVLFGGLLMAVALIMAFTFIGSQIRPLACLVGGIGFGLFIDEVGKFMTSDNDYFWAPSFAIMYATCVALLIGAYLAFQRRGMAPAEDVAAAANIAVAGLTGGLSPVQRTAALALLARSGKGDSSPPGSAETAALIAALPDAAGTAPDPVGAVQRVLSRWFIALGERLRLWPLVLIASAVVLAASTALAALGIGRGSSAAATTVVVVSLAGALVAWGLWIAALRAGDGERGLGLIQSALILNLLITQVAVFRFEPWAAVALVVAGLVVLGLAWGEAAASRATQAPVGSPGTPGGARR